MKLGSTLSRRGEKEGKNKAVELLTFLESHGHAESNNNQRARSKQASALPEIYINPAFPPVPGFVLGAATKLNGKVAGASNI